MIWLIIKIGFVPCNFVLIKLNQWILVILIYIDVNNNKKVKWMLCVREKGK